MSNTFRKSKLFLMTICCLMMATLLHSAPAHALDSDSLFYCVDTGTNNSKAYLKNIVQCKTGASDLLSDVLKISQHITVTGTNCDPSAYGDCQGRATPIDYKNFTVDVHYHAPVIDKDYDETLQVSYGSHDNAVRIRDIGVDATFNLVKKGSKACIDFSGGVDLGAGTVPLLGDETHCIDIPPPVSSYSAPSWGKMIAPVCTDYRAGTSKYTIPITGVVVECVEDTMRNIFALKQDGSSYQSLSEPLFALNDPTGAQTFFSRIQENLRGAVMAFLTLYVMMYGFKVIMGQQIPSKGDFVMAVLKFAMVAYFTLGTGIVDWIPRVMDMSKSASAILMEASENMPIHYNYCNFNPDYPNAHTYPANIPKDSPKYHLKGQVDYPPGKETMQLWDTIDCKITKYLGFREPGLHSNNVSQAGINFNEKGASASASNNTTTQNNYSLGVSYRETPMTYPKMLFIILPFWSYPLVGIVVFIFGIASMMFILTLTARIVHIYIMATMAIYFLAFISPIILPAVLFQYTKNIFDNWLKMLISYALQPIILFTFLALCFAVTDYMMYGSNTNFCSATDSIQLNNGDQCGNPQLPDGGIADCQDNSAMACILFKKITTAKIHLDLLFFQLDIPQWQIDNGSGGSYFAGVFQGEATNVWVVSKIFLQLTFVYFMLNSLIGTVENLSQRLTDAVGGGAASMSGVKVMSPSEGVGKSSSVYGQAMGSIAGALTGGASRAARGVNNIRHQRFTEQNKETIAAGSGTAAERAAAGVAGAELPPSSPPSAETPPAENNDSIFPAKASTPTPTSGGFGGNLGNAGTGGNLGSAGTGGNLGNKGITGGGGGTDDNENNR